ncbi:hypothetical protein [Streptomyces sp. bgisy091]|uniref:hypothetical protein n=1 Tax=Streptomyces sp. bgisy091 TaxID=3413778 RepID=UPI003D71005B
MTRAHRPLRAALRASGLRAHWRRAYPALRDPSAMTAAEAHVLATLATLPLTQRAGYAAVLRALPLARRVTSAGRSPGRRGDARDRAVDSGEGMDAVASLPGFREVLRSSTALALLGALDGPAGREAAG